MARNFNNSASQYLELASAPATGVPLTLACWFRPVATAATYDLINIGTSSGSIYFNLYANPTGTSPTIGAASADNSTPETIAATTTTYPANAWSHACAVYASSTSRAAYLGGAGKGTATASSAPTGLTQADVGAFHAVGGVFGAFTGQIAEVAIWNAALSDVEVAWLAGIGVDTLVDLPLRIRRASLVAYWKLDGRTSPEWDYSGHGNRIALVNGPSPWTSPDFLNQQPDRRRLFAASSGGNAGTGAGTTRKVTGSGSGSASDPGSAAGTTRHATGSGAGSQADAGTGSGTTGRVSGSGSGSQLDAGAGGGTTARVTGSGAGSQLDAGSGSPSTGRVIGSAAGTQADAGSGAGTLGRVTGEGFSTPVNPASGSGTLGRVSGTAEGSQLDTGSAAGTLGHVTGSGSSTPTDPGSGAGTTARVAGSAAGSQLDAGSGAGTVGRVIGSGASTPGNTGTGSGTTGRVTGSGSGSSSPETAGIYWPDSYFAATYFAPTYWPGVTAAVVVSAIADPDETIFELVPAVPSPWETVFELSSPAGSSGEGSSYWPHGYFSPSFFAPPYWGGEASLVLDTDSVDSDATAFELVSTVPIPWETVFVLI